jgi:hypothetical protein
MVCECAGCTEFGCNYFTIHRWTGDMDFKTWDITTGNAWRDYLNDNQPQNTQLLWRIRYDGEPYDTFMRQLYPRSSFHQWEDTWMIITGGPVRDNLLCSPWWGVRLQGNNWGPNGTTLAGMGFTIADGADGAFYWKGIWSGVSGGLALPFAIDVGCLRCAKHGQVNSGSSWPNPPGFWHDTTLDYAGSIPDQFQLPTEQDVINWIAAKQISDQALYPGQYLPDVLPSTWRERLRPNESNYNNSGLPARLITQAALWSGDRLRRNPTVGCVPGIISWSNRRGGHPVTEPSSVAPLDADSNYARRVSTGQFSGAWWEGFAQSGGEYVQHTTYVTLSEETPAIVLMGGRNVEGHNPLDDPVNAKVEADPADWVTPIVNWLATGNKYLILDNPACNILPGGVVAYPQVADLGLPAGGQAYWPIVYPSSTTGHAAAANAMLSALGSSMSFGDLICLSRQGEESGSPLSNTSIDLVQVGSDPLRDGFSPQTISALGYGYENQRWGWKISGGTPLVQATRRVAASFSDLTGYDEIWTCVAVERFANGSVILIGGWEQSWEGLGVFTDGAMNSIIWSNLLDELPT